MLFLYREAGGLLYRKGIFLVRKFLFAVIGFALLLQLVQIPAIYLPENNIFDVTYYGKEILNGILAKNTGQKLSKIVKDTERDFFMSSAEAKEYGLVDKILEKSFK